MRLTKIGLMGSTALLALACTSIPGIPTIPPIPSFPPIGPSGATFPPGVIPSADANSGICLLLSAAEVSSVMGGTAIVTGNDGRSCSYTFANIRTLVVSLETADLQSARIPLGNTAKDLTVGGLPAVSGVLPFVGQPALFVQRGAQQLQFLGVLTGSDDATMAKIVQLATTAVGRWQ